MRTERRIKLKKLEKEAVLRERRILFSAVAFFSFILPYILHFAINVIQHIDTNKFGNITQTLNVTVGKQTESIQIETYLVGALARYSEVTYEDETLKAIVVVLRSNAVCQILKGDCVTRDSFYTDEELRILWGREYEVNLQRYQDVVTATEGIVLFYNGEIVEVPFHKLSAGKTRSSELWRQPVDYVCSVESAEDMYADRYYEIREIKKDFIEPDFEILSRDAQGYVLMVRIKGKEVSGEEFRKKYNLPSACFEYDEGTEFYTFYSRGCGHGFGLSLYGANCLAVKGWHFAEILQYYYPGIEIRKENRSDISA